MDEIEYGLRLLPPHVNAGEVMWMPDLYYAIQIKDETTEFVQRHVGPWESLERNEAT